MSNTIRWLAGPVVIDWNKISFPLTLDGKPVATFTELEQLLKVKVRKRRWWQR